MKFGNSKNDVNLLQKKQFNIHVMTSKTTYLGESKIESVHEASGEVFSTYIPSNDFTVREHFLRQTFLQPHWQRVYLLPWLFWVRIETSTLPVQLAN
jgi:hypothetical protein